MCNLQITSKQCLDNSFTTLIRYLAKTIKIIRTIWKCNAAAVGEYEKYMATILFSFKAIPYHVGILLFREVSKKTKIANLPWIPHTPHPSWGRKNPLTCRRCQCKLLVKKVFTLNQPLLQITTTWSAQPRAHHEQWGTPWAHYGHPLCIQRSWSCWKM